ncbi:uncharacterized protein LOC141525871 [Cotesia typhae]
MIPESNNVCQATESTLTGEEVTCEEDKPRKYQTEKEVHGVEVASVTAWRRYQNFITLVNSHGIEYNNKLLLEAMFRGNDLRYHDHRSHR